MINNKLRETCEKVYNVQRLIEFVKHRYYHDFASRNKLLTQISKKYETLDGFTLFIDGEMNRGQYVRLLYAHKLSCFGDNSYEYFLFGNVKMNK